MAIRADVPPECEVLATSDLLTSDVGVLLLREAEHRLG
jgi:hypothetical protein